MSRFNLSRWATGHPALVGFLVALLFVAGAVQFLHLGRAEDPGFTLKDMIVSASWPGASAAQMQAQVADPLERKLRATESIETIQTYCVDGACVLTLSLFDGAPPARVPEIWQQVRRELSDLRPSLPDGVALSANDEYSDVYGYVFLLTGAENARLVQQAEHMRRSFLRIPGAGKVQIAGEVPRQIVVAFDPARLAGMGITPGQVARALSRRNMVTPAGTYQLPLRVPVRIAGEADGAGAVENTMVATPGGAVRVGDIATVSRGYADPPPMLVRHQGQPAVSLSVAMRPGADGLAFGKALRAQADQLRSQLPAGMMLSQVEDQSVTIREAVDTFLVKFFAALTVVLIVAFLTLGLRTGIVVALSVPLTLAIVALFMGVAGIGLERISLGALILSLGLLVDDAIISVEAMAVQLEKGASRMDAAAYAWTHTAFPMLTGTLLTVAGFLPAGLARSTTSEYAGGIFWVTGAALLVSWIVAVVFTPYLGVKLLPMPDKPESHDLYDRPVYRRLRATVSWCIARRGLIVAGTAGLLAVSLAGALLVRQQFFPASDRPELIVDIAMRPGSSIGATSAAVAQIEKGLARDRDIASLNSYIGDGVPRFYLPFGPQLPNPATATVMIVARDLAARERLVEKIGRLRVTPDAHLHPRRLSLGPSLGFPVQYRVAGPDVERLRAISGEIADVLRTTQDATAVQVNWGLPSPAAIVRFDAARLGHIGGDRTGMADDVNIVLSGMQAGEVLDGNKRAAILLRGAQPDRTDPARLEDVAVTTAQGSAPLGQLGRVSIAQEQPILWTRNGEPVMTVQADMAGNVQASQILARAKPRIDRIAQALPPGYRIEIGGDEELSAKANKAIVDLLPVASAVMLLLLMIQLQSIRHVLLVLATAPLGLIGAVAALLVTGAPFGFVALLGLIALAGMIMRNSIILVDQVQVNQAGGASLNAALLDATISRSRPVVLTALAAVLAFIPLSFNIFWGPMAIVMIGGLAGATLLTLLALPALYALVFTPRAGSSEDIGHD
ncbi:hypothetical protein L288_16915 [Sphingobium quisquiliarum P25]|uniref:Cobalt transporter n=1 Tax=Sphingobium quisquiliarum P25 TaxID=1329909 RepID=T0GNI6_9SPHN|nr:efflux RND transporter permease subunit [Sphingobium quisquiliarum]EQB02242.1 hypothetical protein L288_16915 [Sphingobium quisquiliarum P25]